MLAAFSRGCVLPYKMGAPDHRASNAERWEGWGTALKPAHEPIVMARKPLIGTVAANVLAHDTGALNIDACRIGMSDEDRTTVDARSGAGYTDQDFLAGVGRDPGERSEEHTSELQSL